ncbi:hypothetical protein R6Q57_000560 [Mikania cordata]
MFKSKLNRFNELFLQVKSRYKSGWSDEKYIQEARQLYINDPSNKNFAAFTYEHVWNVMKEHNINKEDFEVQLHQVTTTRPIGRDKAKAEAKGKGKAKLKGKAGKEPSEYDLRKLKLIDF